MKQFSTFLNGILASALVFIVVFAILPGAKAQTTATPAATQTPEPQSEPAPVCDANRNIHVSGTAVVNVLPDRVLIQFGVESNGRTAATVQAINTVTIEKVVKAVKALGVDAKDIVTDWYVVQPVYEEYSSLRIKGYRINNTIAVTLRNAGKTNDVITAALQAGVNEVQNVELYTSELRKYRDQAREMAMKAALEKAQALALAAGTQTSCVLNISENTWSYYNGWWYGGYGGGRSQNIWTQNVSQNATTPATAEGALSEAGPVSLGQISVKAEVSATFGLK